MCIGQVNAGNQFFGLAIGFTVTAGACSGGPVSGGAFNPAVGFGLNLMSTDYQGMWIYALGPMTGALFAALAFYITNLEVVTLFLTACLNLPHLNLLHIFNTGVRERARPTEI